MSWSRVGEDGRGGGAAREGMGGEDRGEYRGVEWSRAGYGRVG